jgi:hypothetical protein
MNNNIESQLEQLNKISINFDNFKIDVGAASIAPHAATWLLNEPDCFVLVVEPNPLNIENLNIGNENTPEYKHVSTSGIASIRAIDRSIMKYGEVVTKYNDNSAFILQAAIDNVSKPMYADFYCTDLRNRGCSSLLKPTSNLGLDVENVVYVDVCSLSYILDQINFPKDKTIKFIKTDTQGKDYDVVRSLGEYLSLIEIIKSEYDVKGQYLDSCSKDDFYEFMKKNNFNLLQDNGVDFIFVNNRYYNPNVINTLSKLPNI